MAGITPDAAPAAVDGTTPVDGAAPAPAAEGPGSEDEA